MHRILLRARKVPAVIVLAALLIPGFARATVHDVNVANFAFSPTGTVVQPGDTVRWHLVSGTHTTTSTSDSPKMWDSGTLNSPGQTFEVAFTAADGPGPFPYLCSFHSSTMKDTIFMAPLTDPAVTTQIAAENLQDPVFVTSSPDDSTRLFVVENPGFIRIVKNGSVLTRPFLDISAEVNSASSERGLLGLAFHPDYTTNGYFYVNYTDLDGNTHIARFTVSSDPDSADAATEFPILNVTQPYQNHNAGMLEFGPNDGYLYIGLGDGGLGGDPENRAQTLDSLLGKMLRIDVDGGSPYAIPADNPYVGTPNARDELWAIGLRNPWRWSFDRSTGDLFLADVGQGEREEINIEPFDSPGGVNYGWRLKEGTLCYDPATNCDPGGITTEPNYEYGHLLGRCAITGGYIYRGCAMPALNGYYFFADYCSGEVWAFHYDGQAMGPVMPVFTLDNFDVVSFGQDAYGELYIVEMSAGRILKIVPDGVPSQCPAAPSCCIGPFTGNTDCDPDDKTSLSDVTRLIDRVYLSKAPLCCEAEGNTDGDPDSKLSLSDITLLIDHVYLSKRQTAPCQ